MEKFSNWWNLDAFEGNDYFKKQIDKNFNDINIKIQEEEKKKNECFSNVELINLINTDLNNNTKNYMKKKEFKEYINEKKDEMLKINELKIKEQEKKKKKKKKRN